MSEKSHIENKILNNEDLNLTAEQKQAAIEKEEHFRKLYHSIFDLNSTKDIKQLANELIQGYNKMLELYQDPNKDLNDQNYIIKFAFRDFFLLIFINMKHVFDESEFLKNLHKEVYLSQEYVNLEQFARLIDYCKQLVADESK